MGLRLDLPTVGRFPSRPVYTSISSHDHAGAGSRCGEGSRFWGGDSQEAKKGVGAGETWDGGDEVCVLVHVCCVCGRVCACVYVHVCVWGH